jgi:ferredoxin
MKALVDKSGCIACGMCVSICPDAFQIGSDGLAEVYVDVPRSCIDVSASTYELRVH